MIVPSLSQKKNSFINIWEEILALQRQIISLLLIINVKEKSHHYAVKAIFVLQIEKKCTESSS